MTRAERARAALLPKEVVVAAYEAANRGQHARATAFVAPDIRRDMLRRHAEAVRTGKQLRRALQVLKGRRTEADERNHAVVRALLESNRMLVALRMGSARFFKVLWGVATHDRSVTAIKVTRQVIRGSRATVHVTLTLRNGVTVRDSEPLVRRRGRWLLG